MKYAPAERAFIEQSWQWFHAHPELSINTIQTASYIEKNLRAFGYDEVTVVDGGVIAKWDTSVPGPVFCLRSDIDALQFTVDEKAICDHACGHDAHAAILLTTAKILKEKGLIKKGKLVLLFQPGEEDNIGALKMIKSGLLDEIEEMVAAHITTLEIGRARPSFPNHGCAILTADFKGKNSHASAPEKGVNALEIACTAVDAMKTMTLSLTPAISHSCKATFFDATGSSTNTIPDRAVVCWDMRSKTNDLLEEMYQRGQKIIKAVAHSFDASVDFRYESTPAANPGPNTIELTTKVITDILGHCDPIVDKASDGGDDFHTYAKELGISSAYIELGASCTPMHVYGMSFDHKALEYGVEMYVNSAIERLG